MSDAVHTEASDVDTVTTEWLGHDIELPASTEGWDIDVNRAFAAGDVVRMLELLVGKRRFAEIEKAHRAAHDGVMTNGDLKPLGDKIAELYGFDSMGE